MSTRVQRRGHGNRLHAWSSDLRNLKTGQDHSCVRATGIGVEADIWGGVVYTWLTLCGLEQLATLLFRKADRQHCAGGGTREFLSWTRGLM